MSDSLYKTLRHPRAFRILKVHPGCKDSDVNCDLLEHDLDNGAEYEALSYVWGSFSQKKAILCNGQTVLVTQTLENALRRLRYTNQVRLLWVDALCINQNDLAERSAQVAFMRDIYSSAHRVVVWLGSDDASEARLAQTLLQAIATTCQRKAAEYDEPWADMLAEERVACCELTDLIDFRDPSDTTVKRHWQALASLYSRPYWSRAWCVQEIASARSSSIILGETDLTWNDIGWVTGWLQAQANRHDFKLPPLLDGIDSDDTQRVEVMQRFSSLDMSFDTLLDALRSHRDFDATDLRDKVYAILGLVPYDPLTKAVRVDYEQTVVATYTQVAVAALEVYSDLAILSYVQHPSEYPVDSSFPSWVPRWDTSFSESTPIRLASDADIDWSACGTRALTSYTFSPPSSLTVRGFVFDDVSLATQPMTYKQFNLSSPTAEPSPVLPLLEAVFAQRPIDLADEITYREVLSLAKTLTLEMDLDWYGVVLDMDEHRYFADFCDYIRHLVQDMHNAAGPETSSTSPIVQALLDRTTTASEAGDWRRYETAASRMCDGRRFFQTKYMDMTGLGPATMREQDIIVVLFGGRTPYVLRQEVDEHGNVECYRFIGEAYVSYIMRGAAIEYLEKGHYDEVEFELR